MKSAFDKLILASASAMGKRKLSSCSSGNNKDIGDEANDNPQQGFDHNFVMFWHKETLGVAPHIVSHHLCSVYQVKAFPRNGLYVLVGI